MKPLTVLAASFCCLSTLHAEDGHYKLEVRVLQVSGQKPTDATLSKLVDEPLVLVAKTTISELRLTESKEVKETTHYRYGTEFSEEGKAVEFADRDIGMIGKVSVVSVEGKNASIAPELTWTFKDGAVLYGTSKAQVLMPVFNRIPTLDPKVDVKLDGWSFRPFSATTEKPARQYIWAYRLTKETVR